MFICIVVVVNFFLENVTFFVAVVFDIADIMAIVMVKSGDAWLLLFFFFSLKFSSVYSSPPLLLSCTIIFFDHFFCCIFFLFAAACSIFLLFEGP